MSHLSQRRDLEDTALIDAFAREVRTIERLEMLYLLTYVDMASVSAENWTSWKAGLLRTLYERTRGALLAEGLDAPAHDGPAGHRRERTLARLGPQAAEFVAGLPERYLNQHASRPALMERDFALWSLARRSGFAGELQGQELTLSAPDRPGLLALFTAALAANGLDVLAAEVLLLGAGLALDRFTVRETGGGAPSPARWQAAKVELLRLLAGEEDPAALVRRRLRRASWASSSAPSVPTRLRVDQSGPDTILDVVTEDRPGLLYTLAEALHAAGVSIALARIATEGNRATDAFYLLDAADGRLPGRLQDPGRMAQVVLAVERAIASLAGRG